MQTPPLAAQLLVLAKEPRPGRAKTRLSPALTPVDAAGVARAALLDTLDAAAGCPVLRRTVVLDGSPAGWLPPGLPVLPQRGDGLGERLAAAFSDAWAQLPVPMLLVGMDTPQAGPELLTGAVQALLSPGTDAVLGTAEDGGWWALGLHRPAPGIFHGVPMSTADAGAVQRLRLAEHGLTVRELPVLRDLDHVGDIAHVAAGQPAGTRLRALARQLDLVP